MADSKDYTVDSPDELDETLDKDVEELEARLENLEKPEELNLSNSIKTAKLNEMYDKLKSLPRDQLLTLLANMKHTVTNNEQPHDFVTSHDGKKEKYRDALKQKLKELKLRRSGKKALQTHLDNMKQSVEQPKSSDESDHGVELDEATKLARAARNKKRRERRKKNKDVVVAPESLESVS